MIDFFWTFPIPPLPALYYLWRNNILGSLAGVPLVPASNLPYLWTLHQTNYPSTRHLTVFMASQFGFGLDRLLGTKNQLVRSAIWQRHTCTIYQNCHSFWYQMHLSTHQSSMASGRQKIGSITLRVHFPTPKTIARFHYARQTSPFPIKWHLLLPVWRKSISQ